MIVATKVSGVHLERRQSLEFSVFNSNVHAQIHPKNI